MVLNILYRYARTDEAERSRKYGLEAAIAMPGVIGFFHGLGKPVVSPGLDALVTLLLPQAFLVTSDIENLSSYDGMQAVRYFGKIG